MARKRYYIHLTEALGKMPEFLRSKDLISLGLFQSYEDVCYAKKRGQAPPYIVLSSRKIVYPKALLIEWLTDHLDGGDNF